MFKQIQEALDKTGISYDILEHEPIITSEEAAAARKDDDALGLKCLLLSTDSGYVLAVIPGYAKLDSSKARAALGVSDVRFADPDVVQEVMGCEVGGCYPFGQLVKLPVYMDPSVSYYQCVVCNAGRRDRSVRLTSNELQQIIDPIVTPLVKDV